MRRWWFEKFYPRRWQVFIACLFIGLAVGGLVALAKRESDRQAATNARQDRTDDRLAAAIRDIAAIKNPSSARRRKQNEVIIKSFTPGQLRRLRRRLGGLGAAPPTALSPRTQEPSAGTNPPRPGVRPRPRPRPVPSTPPSVRPLPSPPPPVPSPSPPPAPLPDLLPTLCQVVPLPAVCP